MSMKQYYFVLFLLFLMGFTNEIVAQSRRQFTITDTIPIRSGTNKYRLYRLGIKWLDAERGTRLIARNFRERQLLGKGYFIYHNHVQLQDVFLGPRANERTKGSIVFNIFIDIQDSIILVKFYQFLHEAAYSEYGSMSFGNLMDYERVPPGKCMEAEEWCNAVWADMKSKSELECKYRVNRMIPAVLVRRRTYRSREEIVTDTVQRYVDPDEYLKIEHYIIHDKKDAPDPIEEPAEIVKDEKEEPAVDEPVASDESVEKEEKTSKKAKKDTVEEKEPKVAQEKRKKEKPVKENKVKEKKKKASKKSKSYSDDDYYDDDDYDDDDDYY